MSPLRPRPKAFGGLALATLLTVGCEPPPVVPTQDKLQNRTAARIDGHVVMQGPARGNAVVLIYDATRPPPPQGTGRPLSFTVIPQATLFGEGPPGPANEGPFTAPFSFGNLAAGRYLLRGFIDVDTCLMGLQPCHGPDFNPFYTVTAEPNVHDVGGAAVDPTTFAPRVVEVGVDAEGKPVPTQGVAVSFGKQAIVQNERPVFEVAGTPRFEPGTGPKVLQLRARAIREGVMDLQAPVFRIHFGPDTNGDGQPDLWPRVVVRKLADTEAGLLDENDLDNNGVLDAQGSSYPRADGQPDESPQLVVLAAGLAVDAYRSQLFDGSGHPLLDKTLEVSELTVGIQPVALDARNPAAPVRLKDVPSGRYAVVVMQSSGQVWRVPNELSPRLAPGFGLPPVESQAFAIEIP